ncbi:MAG: hypothetical protein RLZZ230_371 [Candidatus Parcubacteria bacterium]
MNNFREGGFKKPGSSFGGKPSFGGQRSGGFGGNRGGGGGGFSGGRDRGDRGGDRGGRGGQSDRPTEMHSATCSTCHKSCEVPFRPSGDKPVYCSECFGKQKSDENNSRGGDRHDGGRSFDNRAPREDRPVRTERAPERSRDGDADIKQRLTIIESRLNRILDLINPPTKAGGAAVEVKTATKKEERKIEKEVKKVVDAPALKKAVAKAVAPKKEVANKVVAKKAVAKKVAPKKVVTKTVVKKVAKKATK